MASKPATFSCLLLLVVAAYLECISGFSPASASLTTTANSGLVKRGRSFYPVQDVRRLRTEKVTAVGGDDEDRAFEPAALTELTKPVMEKLTTGAKTLVEKLKLSNRKSADNLFTRFKVDQAGPNVLASTQFEKWAAAVTKTNAKSPGVAETAMIATLTTRYGDEAVVNMLVAARGIHRLQSTVSKLENAQLTAWLASGWTADDVFTLLKLDEKGTKLFESPAVNSWVSYVAKLGVSNSDETVFLALKARYDDASLAKMLVQAKDIRSTRNIAASIEAAQLKRWGRDGKTADEVFKLLKLEENGGKLLENPALTAWISYVLNMGKDPYDLLLVRLKTSYDDGALVTKILIPAQEVASTKAVASGLQEALLKDWYAKGKSIDDVYSLLKLEGEGTQLFKNPATAVWASYATKLDDEVMAFSRLNVRFGEVQMARMLSSADLEAGLAKQNDMEAFTGRMLALRFKIWFMDRVTPDGVATKLGAHDTRDTKILLEYFDFYVEAARVSVLPPHLRGFFR